MPGSESSQPVVCIRLGREQEICLHTCSGRQNWSAPGITRGVGASPRCYWTRHPRTQIPTSRWRWKSKRGGITRDWKRTRFFVPFDFCFRHERERKCIVRRMRPNGKISWDKFRELAHDHTDWFHPRLQTWFVLCLQGLARSQCGLIALGDDIKDQKDYSILCNWDRFQIMHAAHVITLWSTVLHWLLVFITKICWDYYQWTQHEAEGKCLMIFEERSH